MMNTFRVCIFLKALLKQRKESKHFSEGLRSNTMLKPSILGLHLS